ncbi:VanZ family protein [Marinicellulosiphila megalodicopiae]|uniref:VanZ family protein n=1 Tax=Marinicellulosiphila megalodicopiae TaxID=2724896 RepID=UPI003BB0993B
MVGLFQLCSKLGFLLCFILIALFSLSDGQAVAQVGQYDKVVHLFSYFVLSLCFWIGFYKTLEKTMQIISVNLALIGYGILIEVLQGFVPARFPSMMDAVANAVGILLGFLLIWILKRYDLKIKLLSD